jgi:DNA uptake protein ComE-like DNA-binding protein
MEDQSKTVRRAFLSAERGALLLILLLIGALACIWFVRRGGWRDEAAEATTQPAGQYATQLDPNTASVQALAHLPGLGETRARAIVDYRSTCKQQPAFTQPNDLRKVKRGIGTQTIARLTPFLAFPSTAPDAEELP